MAMDLRKMMRGEGSKDTPQLGGANPKNIDQLVAAGILTEEEGKKAKKRWKEKNQNGNS